MARRANYGFEKRQKELKRQQKKDEKAEKKRLKKEAPDGSGHPDTIEAGAEDGAAAGDASDPTASGTRSG